MNETITSEELITLVKQSGLDQTIKDILIRDIQSEGATDFYIDQVSAYFDKAIEVLSKGFKNKKTD